MNKKTNVVVLGCNFTELAISRFLHRETGKNIQITVIDHKNHINFTSNIPIEVFNDHNSANNLKLGFDKFLHKNGFRFILEHSPKLTPKTTALVACEAPLVELTFSFADWLKLKKQVKEKKVTLFTPPQTIAEDVGEKRLDKLLPTASAMEFGYVNSTISIKKI